jgi:hypothetical protein
MINPKYFKYDQAENSYHNKIENLIYIDIIPLDEAIHNEEKIAIAVDAEKDEASKLIGRKNKLTTGINVSGSDIIETAQNILSNPEQLWQEGDLTMKRLVQNMVFDGPIRYSPSTNFGTSKFSLPFSMLSNLTAQNSNMVES